MISAAYFGEKADSRISLPICYLAISETLSVRNCSGEPKARYKSGGHCVFDWNGPITAAAVIEFSSFVESSKTPWVRSSFHLRMRSQGGDIDAAMELGRFLRKYSAGLEVDRYCASACVLVLAGGVSRIVWPGSQVVIHRPYRFAGEAYGIEGSERMYKERRRKITNYLSEMNIPIQLLDAMNSIPPNEGRVLSDNEMTYFLLNQKDPIYSEETDAQKAKEYGISMPEYYRRKNLADECYESLDRRPKLAPLSEYKKCAAIYEQE